MTVCSPGSCVTVPALSGGAARKPRVFQPLKAGPSWIQEEVKPKLSPGEARKQAEDLIRRTKAKKEVRCADVPSPPDSSQPSFCCQHPVPWLAQRRVALTLALSETLKN